MTLQEFYRVLTDNGFVRKSGCPYIRYVMMFPHPKYGSLPYSVEFKVNGLELVQCVLAGCTLNPETGVIGGDNPICVWEDVDTAAREILPKFVAAHREFFENERAWDNKRQFLALEPLLSLLKKAGFTRTPSEFWKFKLPYNGINGAYFTVVISTNCIAGEYKFISCKLTGPVINGKTGVITRSAVLGEWTTFKGAVEGLIPKVRATMDDTSSKVRKFAVKKRNKS